MNRNKNLKYGRSSMNYNFWLCFLHNSTTPHSTASITFRMQPMTMAPTYRTSEWRTGVVLLSLFLAAATSGQSGVAAFSFSGIPTRASPSTTAAGSRKTLSARREGPHLSSSSSNSRAAVKRGRNGASGWHNSLSMRLESPDARSTR